MTPSFSFSVIGDDPLRCLGAVLVVWRARRDFVGLAVLVVVGAAGRGWAEGPGTPQLSRLKLSTWNMEWLTARRGTAGGLPADVTPREAGDYARLRWYAGVLDADVVALEEVDGPEMAARVFTPDRYRLHFTGDGVVQRVGFAVRAGLAFTANPDVTALDV